MAGALDNLSDGNSTDDANSALSALIEPQAQIDLNDVQSRKDVFNRAVQRILASRDAVQIPYAGSDLGLLSFGASMGKASGMPVAEGFTSGMLDRALAQQKQQEAAQAAEQQRSGLDLQAQMAQILGGGGSLQDAAALGAIGGNDKASDSLAKLALYDTRAQVGQGATVTAARALMAADPTIDFPTAFSIAKSGIGQGNTITNGKVTDIGGAIDTSAKRKGAEKTAEEQAQEDVKKKASFPKATAALNNALAYDDIVDKTIDEVTPNVGMWTAGFLGSEAAKMRGTAAYDLAAKLQTIKANLGFDKLQEMRDSSPTGGAIGQVSDFEEKLLSSAVQNIDNAQSPDQLKEALQNLKQIKAGQQQRLKQAYKMDYGKFLPQDGTQGDAKSDSYGTPESIRSAYKSGKLSREDAKKLLVSHGFE